MKDFDKIVSRIANGEHVAPFELLPYLCLESKKQRCEVNKALAEAYFQIETKESPEQAKVFIQRTWVLSGFSADLLPLYIKIFSASGDIAGIRDAYKQLGMKMAAEGNISEAIRYFNLWQYAYANFNHLDRYEYDFDIIDCMDRLAEPHRFDPALPVEPLCNRKIRLAYLMRGLTEVNSVLLKINLLFAKAHDKSRFEITFFAPEPEPSVLVSLQGQEHMKLIESYNCNVVLAPNLDSVEERLLALTKSIYDAKPDILITSITLADFNHYFITSLRPAPVLIGFNMGPPPQFISPNLDWGISWTKHPLIDCPVGCSLVDLEIKLPKRSEIAVYSKEEFNLPKNACILLSGGRHPKFQDMEFWKAILDVLTGYPNVYYLAVGVEECQIPFLESLLSPEIKTRIRFLGWREDYLRILGMADIVIDTYPSGSGVVLLDAMALDIPIVSFENNYMRPYDQTDWSPAEEFITVSDVIVPRGDFEQFKRITSRLIEDKECRTSIAHHCRKNILQTHGNPERMVRRCEEIYVKVFEDKQQEHKSVNNIEAAIAHSTGHGRNPFFLPSTEGLSGISQKTASFSQYIPTPKQYADKNKRLHILNKEDKCAISALVPTPKEFIFRDSGYRAKRAKLSYCKFSIPQLDKNSVYELCFVLSNRRKKWINAKVTPYTKEFKEFLVVDPETNEDLLVTAKDIYCCLKEDYDFAAAYSAYHRSRSNNTSKPAVAFTVQNSSIKEGGPIILFQYVNWLSDLGVDVAVYSNDKPPTWTDIKGKFYFIKNLHERYSAITRPVIIVYSIRELQYLLSFGETENKVIYYFCQAIEEFLTGKDYSSLMAPKPMFEFLYSLPVGCLAVSPHIRDYFAENYNQRTHNIFNGIDTNFFKPRPKKNLNKTINILSSGNPFHRFKGKADIRKALNIIAKTHPDIKFNFTIVCGNKIDEEALSWVGANYELTLKLGLSHREMRQAYYDSDIYINSSWYEGFGMPPLEAMACGTPVIQADNQGLTGIVVDRKNCLLIPPNNPQKMAGAIETLIEDDVLRNDLIKNGIETVRRFTKVKQYELFVTEFEKILHCKFDKALVEAEKRRLESGLDSNYFETSETSPESIDSEADISDNGAHISFEGSAGIKSGKSSEPFFSILVPTYNQVRYLPEALNSLLSQTYDDWEAIVVNDGSTDETAKVMKRYAAKDARIRIFHKENGGVASALNEGLRNARGQWICWLSSDDFFEPNKLSVHLQAIKENPDVGFFHTHYFVLVEKTGTIAPEKLNLKAFNPLLELKVLKFFEHNYINGISIAINRKIFDDVGYFDEQYRNGQDFDMWLRISRYYRLHFINQRTCVTRSHPEQTTNELPLAGIYDSARACLDFLNRREFPAIFPELDLSKPEQALFATENTFKVLVNPASFINRCGYGPALIDRLREWLTQSASVEGKTVIKSQLAKVVGDVQQTDLSEEIKAAFQAMYESLEEPFQYQSYDPVEEIVRHTIRLVKRGDIDEASGLRRYIERISPQTDQHLNIVSRQVLTDQHAREMFSADKIKEADSLERYSPLIDSNEEKTPIHSNLKYWQQLQDNGYFEKHPDYSGLKEYGEDYNIINKHIPLSKEMNVVVIGCGYGREILLIAPHVKHVYGIDVNRTILDKADKFLAERGITNFTSVLADEWKDVVPSNIDLVYSIIVFQHLTRDLVKDYIHGLTKKLSPDGKFLCQFAELDLGTHDAELKPYEPNVRWSKTEIEQLIEECDLTKNSIQTQEAYGQGNWHWAFFGKQGAKLSETKILFYYDRISNFDGSPAGTIIAILNFARAILRDRPNVTIHLTGNLVRHPEQLESFQVIPLPPLDKREEFLADYDVVFFATHIRYFKSLAKPSGQIWVLYQHCWEANDPVSLAHMNDFDAVICLSELHRACLHSQGIGVEKLVTIPNLIDTDIYSPGDTSRNNRSIMFAGGLHPHKCIHVLLDAFRLVRRQVGEAELHIYGDGAMWRGGDEYGNQLKTVKPEGVYFHGYVDNKDMPQVYSKHSILCLPSSLESFGLVTVEAQACGCIPVVHNVGGVAATLADGQTGLLYSPNTVEKLAEAIAKAMELIDTDSSVRRRAIDFVRDNFSINRAAEYIPKLWNRLAIAKESNAVTALFESNDTNSAGAGCERLLQKYPDQPDLLLLQALITLHQGDKEKCKSMLLNLVEKFGMHQMTLNNIGVLLMNEGNSGEALEYFVRAYNVNPCDKNTSLNCSAAWKICGKYNEARMVLFNYLTKVGEDAQALQLLEEINNLIVGAGSGATVVSQQRRSIDEYKAGDGLTAMPYYEPGSSDPLVSVIMPAYNSADYIGQAIESVLIQNYPKFELLIVDDGSTDNTREVILQYKDERIKYFYKENGGPSSARNHAIKQAKGQYIMPLDADDMMVPNFIISHLKEFEKHPEADLVYSDVLLIDKVGNPIKVMNKPEYQDRRHLIRDLFRRGHPIVPFRLGLRRSVFDKIGLYDESLMVAEDYDMMRRFVKAGLKAHHLNEALHIRRMRSDNISRTANVHKAKNHFDVVKRFTDTFRYDELFPDVAWDKIRPEMRQLHAKCLAAVNCVAIGRTYVEANSPIYAKTAFELACSELNNYVRMDPNNSQLHQLLQQCESVRARYEQALPQTVC